MDKFQKHMQHADPFEGPVHIIHATLHMGLCSLAHLVYSKQTQWENLQVETTYPIHIPNSIASLSSDISSCALSLALNVD